MMNLSWISQILAALALAFALVIFAWRLWVFSRLVHPLDRSTPKGRPLAGVLYAFTLGMAPWAKESTRRHLLAYLRGVVFHVGIFTGLGIFLTSPWIPHLPVPVKILLALVAGGGALMGLAGLAARLVEHNLKALSTLDDYFAVFVVTLFLAFASLWLAGLVGLPAFYGVSAAMLVYAPLGKIRHCLYFAFSRLFFGLFVGRRAVHPHTRGVR